MGSPGGRGADFRPYFVDFIFNFTRSAQPRRGAADFLDPFFGYGAAQGRLILFFGWFRCDAPKTRFFDRLIIVPNSEKLVLG